MSREPPLPLDWDCASCAALQADNERLREIILDALDEEVALRMMQKWCEDARAALEPKP